MQKCRCRKYSKKSSLKHKFRILLFIVLVFVIFFIVYYMKVVCPIVVSLSEEKIRAIATSTISEVVGDVLISENISYSDIAKVKYSSADTIDMVEIDTVEANLLIRKITKEVQDKFDKFESSGIDVALGTFTGIPFLYGIGPLISVQLVPVGTISTKISSSFVSAGINQTLHRLYFVVNAGVGMILPAKTQNFNTQLEVLICESLLVGKVPQVYLQGKLI